MSPLNTNFITNYFLMFYFSSVDSNDKLYGGDKKFIAEVVKIVDTLTKQILEELKALGEKVL